MLRGNSQYYIIFVILFITIGVASAILLKTTKGNDTTESSNRFINLSAQPSPTPEPFVFKTYVAPAKQTKKEYQIVMIGDSMTHALGPRGGTLNTFINDLYKYHNIGIAIDNYAEGSNNILQVHEQLENETTYWDSTFPPLLSREFDLILVESFGYNPLSQMGLEDGIKRQTEALNELMEKLIVAKPNSRIVFVATIAPNRENYAKKIILNIETADRIKQAEERMAYIKNHIEYAKQHNLPLVNIYEKSLDATGSGDLKHINPDDFIHPSFEGVDFIGREIAQYIYDNKILPW